MTAPTKDLRPPLSSRRRRLMGVGQLLVIVLVVAVCIANFNKVFKPVDVVTLQASTVGNQLSKQADVKIRGVIVGEVRKIESDGRQATLELDIDPDAIKTIPSDTRARLVPKTLFGERFVDLSVDPGDHARPLQEGDTITEDRSQNTTETEEVLNNLLPVLTAVQPQKLSDTLGAVSQALSGRGKELGDTLVLLNRFLNSTNPYLPDLVANLQKIPAVADLYSQASPDLIAALDNLVTTSETLVQQRAQFTETFRSVTSAANTTSDYLAANRDKLIQVVAVSRPILDLLARYSPEFPCFFRAVAALPPKIDAVIKPDTGLQILAELNNNRGKYVPSDAPQYGDRRGPRCYSLSGGDAPQNAPGGPIKDGAAHPDAPRGTGLAGVLNSYPNLGSLLGGGTAGGQQTIPAQPPGTAAATGTATPNGIVATTPQNAQPAIDPAAIGATNAPGSPEERSLATELTALQMGVRPAQVPAFAPYLTAGTMRGVPVTIR